MCKAFTLIELLLVVTIVAILSLAGLVTYSNTVVDSKMTEGVTGAGMIRTALRTYMATHGRYLTLTDATGAELTQLNISSSDLEGKYFQAENYSVTSTDAAYRIRATLNENSAYWYQVDDAGSETKSY